MDGRPARAALTADRYGCARVFSAGFFLIFRGARAAARACAADTAIARDCCGTRDLPDSSGGIIAARVVHDVALAELADRFAIVAASAEILPRRAIFPSREL